MVARHLLRVGRQAVSAGARRRTTISETKLRIDLISRHLLAWARLYRQLCATVKSAAVKIQPEAMQDRAKIGFRNLK
jgi:hypothetical protein